MADHLVTFDVSPTPVHVPTGTLLIDAARLAGIDIGQPCGGQGRCGRCAVIVNNGGVRRRSTLRLSDKDVAAGYALACQSVIEGDVEAVVLPQEKIERRLTTDRVVADVTVPSGYDPDRVQTIKRVTLTLPAPSMDDQTDDWSRLQVALRQATGVDEISASLNTLRRIGSILRENDWQVAAIVDSAVRNPHSAIEDQAPAVRLIDLNPGNVPDHAPLWGAAIDIGTTTVTCWLVDLISGEVKKQAAEYNRQIARGEDVISRIIYASKNGGGAELQSLVVNTINALIDEVCVRASIKPTEIIKATISGNSTMIHLLLNIPAFSIRLSPFITAVNHVPLLTANEIGLEINPEATIDCLPGVASYVGADITAGVLSSGLADTDKSTLFMDVGTNGEIVLGSRDWLVTCACSAGPAFEGAGVIDGMRATKGAIEEVWINNDTFEPTYRVISSDKPRGICGSGLISLLSELFITGVIDKGGNFNTHLGTERIRSGEHGFEYVIAFADQTEHGRDIAITYVDIDNLVRAKAAIYAGFSVLADRVGVPLDSVEQILIGGSFGKYINVENAIQIGLLPDLPWDRFQFLGNTSVKGAYRALLDRTDRDRIADIAARMTYIELSADNTFYEAFTSALFLPHTDLSKFPSVKEALGEKEIQTTETQRHRDF
ncbi:MAG TPA: ASKHA domain-containing protein [Anaerolineae bacterium]|nr:ASKHA domain-containing protein [Anaerolineae bacterium]